MRLRIVLLCATALMASSAPAASAGTLERILNDCVDDERLQGDYSARDLRAARLDIPAYIDEYSNCREVLRRAELAAIAGSGDAGEQAAVPGGASAHGAIVGPSSPSEHEALRRAREGPPPAVAGGGTVLAATPIAAGAPRHVLPGSLMAVLALMALLGVSGAAKGWSRRR